MPCAVEPGSREDRPVARRDARRVHIPDLSTVSGLRIVIASFAALCAATGVMAGCFEIGQGNIAPEGFVISTIDPDNALAGELTYFAVTVIPNMMITGTAAIIVSIIAFVWAISFVQRRHGHLVLMGLFVAQTLVGGGWMLDMALITFILATRIDKPMNWWRRHMTERVRVLFDRMLLPSVAFYAVISAILIAMTVLMVDDPSWWDPLNILATIMFLPMVLMIIGSVAREIGVRAPPNQAA